MMHVGGEDGSGGSTDDDVGSGGSGDDGGVAGGGVPRDARRMAVFVARGGTPTQSDAELHAALADVPVYSTFERRVFAVGVTAPADLVQLLTVLASGVRHGQVGDERCFNGLFAVGVASTTISLLILIVPCPS